MPRVNISLHPVIRGAMTVSFQGFQVLGFFPVELRPLSQHLANTEYLRTMRIVDSFALGVMFAVYRSPLLGNHSGGHPQPKGKKMTGQGMQVQRTMSLMAMEIDGDAGDSDMGKHQ